MANSALSYLNAAPSIKPVHVCLCAKYTPGQQGGIEQYVLALARSLRRLLSEPDAERYSLKVTMLVERGCGKHIEQAVHQGPGVDLRIVEDTSRDARLVSGLRARVIRGNLARSATHLRRSLGTAGDDWPSPPAPSRGVLEGLDCDLVHFAVQRAFLTDLPSIYQPHDLQHLHLPELFSAKERLERETNYLIHCRRASAIAVASSWVKRDLIAHYGLAPNHVHVTAYAPPNEFGAPPNAEALRAAASRLRLPDRFVFYPAQTYKHKNHESLLRAAALLRDRGGPIVNLVFSGRRNEYAAMLDTLIAELRLTNTVQFLDFVSETDLACVYKLATCTVIPSRFEAASFPMWEAFHAGTPVACSDVTSLPEQAGDAAIVFGATDIAAIAAAVERLWSDAALRQSLAEAGRGRLSQLSWHRTAIHFAALYHHVAGRPPAPWQRSVLEAPPLL